MMSSSAKSVQKHRDSLRAEGLRPVQIWVPDTRAPGFAEEYRRQGALVGAADRANREELAFLDAAFEEWAGDAAHEKSGET
jgi:hypothetical protein